MVDRLARVDWRIGQTLLPEHFIAQEESILADSISRWRNAGLPSYGIGSLQMNNSLLSEGVLSVTVLSLITPAGKLLEVGRNATISPFNLGLPGTIEVRVYCHLISEHLARENDDFNSASDDDEVDHIISQLVLSSEQSYSGAIETFQLGLFEKNLEGLWFLSERYVPPLLRVGKSPYFVEQLERLNTSLDGFHFKLYQEIVASFLSGDSLFTAKQCLKSVYRTQRLLANIKGQIKPHPYFVYEALKELLTEICFYRQTSPEKVASPYKHDNLAVCFEEIFEPIFEQILLVSSKSPYLPFELTDGMYRCSFPREIREAKDVFFLVQKGSVNTQVSVDNLKLSSFSRASLMHQMSLIGCPLTRIERPPFQHPFGPEVDFYQISEGEEWDNALNELEIAFFSTDALKGARFFVYWRTGGQVK